MTTKTISTDYTLGYTISGANATITITPSGTIGGTGMYCVGSGTYQIINSGLFNPGTTIIPDQLLGIYSKGSASFSITNTSGGTISTGNATIGVDGVYVKGKSTVINDGYIYGVSLPNGGEITNNSSGYMVNYFFGAHMGYPTASFSSGSLINFGTIKSKVAAQYDGGILLCNGSFNISNYGTVVNEGTGSFKASILLYRGATGIINCETGVLVGPIGLNCSGNYTGVGIDIFGTATELDLLNTTYVSGASASYSSGTLTVTSGTVTNHIPLTKAAGVSGFTATNDGNGYVLVEAMSLPPWFGTNCSVS